MGGYVKVRLSGQAEGLGQREQTQSKPFKTGVVPSTTNLHNVYEAAALCHPQR